MAKSDAERQRDQRARRKAAGTVERTTLDLPPNTKLHLMRLARHFEISQRDMAVRLIDEKNRAETRAMDDAAFKHYVREKG